MPKQTAEISELTEVRVNNMRRIMVENEYDIATFSEMTNTPHSTVYALVGRDKPKTNIGSRVKKRIDAAFNLGEDWLDKDRRDQPMESLKATTGENYVSGCIDGFTFDRKVINVMQAREIMRVLLEE